MFKKLSLFFFILILVVPIVFSSTASVLSGERYLHITCEDNATYDETGNFAPSMVGTVATTVTDAVWGSKTCEYDGSSLTNYQLLDGFEATDVCRNVDCAIACWAVFDSVAAGRTLLGTYKYQTTDRSFALAYYGVDPFYYSFFRSTDGANGVEVGTIAATTSSLTSIIVNFDTAGNISLYVNGTPGGVGAYPGSLHDSNNEWGLGYAYVYDNTIDARMECAFWDRILTGEEIAWLSNSSNDLEDVDGTPIVNSLSINNTLPEFNDVVNISSVVSDAVGLSHCWFWNNMSNTNSTPIALTGLSDSCSDIVTINVTAGNAVAFTVFVNDTINGISSDSLSVDVIENFPMTFENSSEYPPGVGIGGEVNLSIAISDNNNITGYGFQIYNGSAWKNKSAQTPYLTGTLLTDLYQHLTFDSDCSDAQGNQNCTASVIPTQSGSVSYVEGQNNNAIQLKNSWINSSYYITGANKSVSFWFRLDDAQAADYWVFGSNSDAARSGDSRFYLYVTGGEFVFNLGQPADSLNLGWGPTEDVWYYITLTHDYGVETKIYINGQLNGTKASAETDSEIWYSMGSACGYNLCPYTASFFANMSYDDYALWSRVISPTEVEEAYNTGDWDNEPVVVSPQVPTVQVSVLYTTEEITTNYRWYGVDYYNFVTFSSNYSYSSNNIPYVDPITIIPTVAYYNDTLNCNFTFIDADDDSVNVSVTWYELSDFPSGAVAHYLMNGDATDSSGNGNDGTESGDYSYGVGKLNQAVILNAASNNGRITIPDHTSIQNIWDAGGTVSAWVWMESGPILTDLVWIKGDGSGLGNGILIWVEDDGPGSTIRVKFKAEATVDDYWRTTNSSFAKETWTHIAVTYDADTIGNTPIIYINGLPITIENYVVGSGTRTSDVGKSAFIGASPVDTSAPFDGKIDDLRVYSTALISSDILEIYNSGTGTEETGGATNNNTYDYTFINPTLNTSYQTGVGTGSWTGDNLVNDQLYCEAMITDSIANNTLQSDNLTISNYLPMFSNNNSAFYNSTYYRVNITLSDVDSDLLNWSYEYYNSSSDISYVEDTSCGINVSSCVPYLNQTGLLRWYPMNDSANLTDATGIGEIIPCTNAPTYEQADPFGGTSAIDFERSSNQYCKDTTVDADLGHAGDFTYNSWIKMETAFTTEQYIVSTTDAGNNEWIIFMYGHPSYGNLASVGETGGPTYEYQFSYWYPTIAEWNMVTLKREGTAFKLYINGVLRNNTVIIPYDLPPIRLSIGESIAGSHNFDGVISDLSIWDRALTEGEIKYMFDGDAGWIEYDSGNASGQTYEPTVYQERSGYPDPLFYRWLATDIYGVTGTSDTYSLDFNQEPTISQINITPTSVYYNETLNCNLTPQDVDGDSVNVSVTWYRGRTECSIDQADYILYDDMEDVTTGYNVSLWTSATGTLTRETTIVHSGSSSTKLENTAKLEIGSFTGFSGLTDFTIDGWYYISGHSTNNHFVGWVDDGATFNYIEHRNAVSGTDWMVYDAGNIDTNYPVTFGEWVNIKMHFVDGNVYYYNGTNLIYNDTTPADLTSITLRPAWAQDAGSVYYIDDWKVYEGGPCPTSVSFINNNTYDYTFVNPTLGVNIETTDGTGSWTGDNLANDILYCQATIVDELYSQSYNSNNQTIANYPPAFSNNNSVFYNNSHYKVNITLTDLDDTIANWSYEYSSSGVSPTNLGAHFKFNGDSTDSANNNDGVDTAISYVSGKVGQAAEFDGSTSKVTVGNDTSINNIFENGGTISVWLNASSIGEINGMLLTKINNAAQTGYRFLLIDNSAGTSRISFYILTSAADNAGSWKTNDRVIIYNDWIHFVMIYSGNSSANNPVIYINNVSVQVDEIATPTAIIDDDSADTLIIGNRLTNDRTWDGQIDDLRLFSRILSTEEINELYNSDIGTEDSSGWVEYDSGSASGQIYEPTVYQERVGYDNPLSYRWLATDIYGASSISQTYSLDFNQPSYFDTVTIEPTTIYYNETLHCNITPQDVDGDSVNVSVTWYTEAVGINTILEHGESWTSTSPVTYPQGMAFNVSTSSLTLNKIVLGSTSGCLRGIVRSFDNEHIAYSDGQTGLNLTFSSPPTLDANTGYFIICDASGASYQSLQLSAGTSYPYVTDYGNFTTGVNDNGTSLTTTKTWNIDGLDVNIGNTFAVNTTYDYTFVNPTLGVNIQTGDGTGSWTGDNLANDQLYCQVTIVDGLYTQTNNSATKTIANYPPTFSNNNSVFYNTTHYRVNITLTDLDDAIANWSYEYFNSIPDVSTILYSQTTGTVDTLVGMNGGGNPNGVAAGYNFTTVVNVTTVSLYVNSIVTTPGPLGVAIFADLNDVPSGEVLAYAEIVSGNVTTGAYNNFTFDGGVILQPGQRYWFTTNTTFSGTNVGYNIYQSNSDEDINLKYLYHPDDLSWFDFNWDAKDVVIIIYGNNYTTSWTEYATGTASGQIYEPTVYQERVGYDDPLSYRWLATDIYGSIGTSETYTLDFNQPPNATSYFIIPSNVTTGENPYPNENLNCNFTITDEDSDSTNVSVTWYRNGTINSTYDYTFTDITLGQSYQTAAGTGSVTGEKVSFEEWYCSLDVTDSYYTETFNTDPVEINNYAPGFSNFAETPYNSTHYQIDVSLYDEHGIDEWWYQTLDGTWSNHTNGTGEGLVNYNATVYQVRQSASLDYRWVANDIYDKQNTSQTQTLQMNNLPVINTVYVTPDLPYSDGASDLDCNFNVSDYDGDNVNVSVFWYNNGVAASSSYCYQEFANVSTVCGGLSTGIYGVIDTTWSGVSELTDGIWIGPTADTTGSDGNATLFINYSKPVNATDAIWIATWQNGSGTFNATYTLSDYSCFQDPVQLKVDSNAGVGGETVGLYHSCNDGSGWVTLGYHAGPFFDEEAIGWIMPSYTLENVELGNITTTTAGTGSITENLVVGDEWYCSIDATDAKEVLTTSENSNNNVTVLEAKPTIIENIIPQTGDTVSAVNTTITWNESLISEWLYQETGDSFSATGSWHSSFPYTNLYDGDWGTLAQADVGVGYVYINYTKPSNAISDSKWLIGAGQSGTSSIILNLTIPDVCWTQDILQFRVHSQDLPGHENNWYCRNNTDWHFLYQGGSKVSAPTYAANVYEEAMWWALSSTAGYPNTDYNVSIVLTNASNEYTLTSTVPNATLSYEWDTSSYAAGLYNLTLFSCNVYGCGENISVSDILINTIPVVVPYTLPITLYNNDTLEGWTTITDANEHNQNYSFEWFKNDVNFSSGTNNINSYVNICYQETATEANNCGALGTGAYGSDGISWVGSPSLGYDGLYDADDGASFAGATQGFPGNVYYNYSKPTNALMNYSYWLLEFGDASPQKTTYNMSDYPNCWNQQPLQFRGYSVNGAGTNDQSYAYCWNGTTWQSVASFTSPNEYRMYEEAMYWGITEININNISSSEITVYDDWIFSTRSWDGYDYSAWANASTNVTNRVLRDLTIYSPDNDTLSRFKLNATFSIVDEDEGINCTLDVSGNQSYYQPSSGVTYGAYPNYPIVDGIYQWNISCTSEGDTTPVISENRQFTYDITPVNISDYQTDEDWMTPAIDGTFYMNVTAYDLNNVSHCKLMMNDTGAWENKTTYEVLSQNSTVEMSYVIQSYSTADKDQLAWNIWCNDTAGNGVEGILQEFSVKDIQLPLITIGAQNFVNGSVKSNYFENVTYDITWFDYNLFQAMVNVTCDISGGIYYWEELDFNTTTYNKVDSIDISGLPLQKCTMFSSSSDDHTVASIDDYDVTELSDGLEFTTPEGNVITVRETAGQDIIRDANAVKGTDRYNFEFDFIGGVSEVKFTLEADSKIYYRPSSSYSGHFVVWNENSHSGNWIDFVGEEDNINKWLVTKESDYEYEVEIEFKEATEGVVFESIGGTNIENKSWEFYVGGVINLTGINIYDNTTIVEFCYDITTANSTPGNNVSGCLRGNCTQEFANVSTSCGGLDGGSYTLGDTRSDGNWAVGVEGVPTNMNITYAVPILAALNSTWKYKTRDVGCHPANESSPDGVNYTYNMNTCLSGVNSTVTFRLIESGNDINLSCEGNYISTYAVDGISCGGSVQHGGVFFEEQIIWDMPTDNAFVPGFSNGTYDILYSKDGEFFNQTTYNYNVNESIQDDIYETFHSVVYIYFTNVKSGLAVPGALVTLTNNASNQIDQAITDAYGGVEFKLNASDYDILANGTELLDYTASFVMDYLDNTTFNYIFSYYANFTLYDEATLGLFNTASAEAITLIIECVDRTSQHNIDTTNPLIPIDCDYKTFKFVLDYGDVLGNYYRTFILDVDDTNIWLLNLNTTDAIYNNFRIDDLMNDYDNPRIYITKTINTTEEIITSAYVDIEDKIGAYLMLNHQYHIKIVSDNNPDFIVGDYSADSVGDKVIRLYDVGVYPGSADANYENDVRVSAFYNLTSDIIFFVFNDTRNSTSSMTFTIYEGASADGVILYTGSPTVSDDGDYSAEVSGLNKTDAVVVLGVSTVRKDGETTLIGRILNAPSELALDIVQYLGATEEEQFNWLNLFFIVLLGILLLYSTMSTANFMSLVVVGIAALLKLFNLIRFTGSTAGDWGIIGVAAFLALIAIFAEGSKR